MMKRGALVTVALSGDYGKPRPAVVIQSDLFNQHPSITLLPVTSELREAPLFRITLEPTEKNGLKKISQVMVDKAVTVSRDKIDQVFGELSDKELIEINRALALFLNLAG